MAHILEELRRHHKSDLIDLVKMHLSHLIDVSTDEWDRIVAYVDKEEAEQTNNNKNSQKLNATVGNGGKNSQTKFFTSTSSTASTESSSNSCKLNNKFGPPKEKELASNIFGQPLSKESMRQAMILVDFLNEDENHKLEGIFRKSGTQERQQDLRYMLNNGAKVNLKANRFTPVDASCVLKEFVQKLPEPLLTNNHFELYYELALTIRKDTPQHELKSKNAKRLKIIQLLIHLMPEINRTFFLQLMALLNRVAQSVEVTKMDERSLATIFGQHILCPRNWTPKQIQKNIEIITDAMEFLLIHYDELTNGPAALVADAEIKLKIRKQHGGDSNNQAEEIENHCMIRFCEPQTSGTTTDQALAELYAQVQSMPETPQKRKLIKQFNKQNGFGTPMHVTSKQSSSKWKSLIPPILRPKH